MSLHVATEDSFERLAENMGEMIDGMYQANYVGFRHTKAWEPPINIYEGDECLMVCVELAGMRRDKIDVQIVPGQLTVRGARPDPEPPEEGRPSRLHLLEIHHGQFERVIRLSNDVDVDNARAQYRKGYLWIRLPKEST